MARSVQRNQRRRESVFIPESSSGTGRNALTQSASTQSCRSHRWVSTPWPPPRWQHHTNLHQQQRCSAGDPWEMERSQRAPTPVGKAKDEPLSLAAGVRPALPALSSQGRAVQAGNIHPTGNTFPFSMCTSSYGPGRCCVHAAPLEHTPLLLLLPQHCQGTPAKPSCARGRCPTVPSSQLLGLHRTKMVI